MNFEIVLAQKPASFQVADGTVLLFRCPSHRKDLVLALLKDRDVMDVHLVVADAQVVTDSIRFLRKRTGVSLAKQLQHGVRLRIYKGTTGLEIKLEGSSHTLGFTLSIETAEAMVSEIDRLLFGSAAQA